MTIPTLPVLASVALLATAGCLSARRSEPWSWAETRTPQTVTVRNDNWLDVAVYLVHGSTRFRIGTVGGTSKETFRLKAGAGGGNPWQIMADPIGSNHRYLTEPVVLAPGQRLEVTVGSRISMSTYAIWNH